MRRAAELRQQAVGAGDQAYGAVVVKDGQVVGEGPSRVVLSRDPTAHAEMEAIRDAAKRLGTRDLRGCELYSTSRPCKMCETAAYWAGVSRMYFGTEVTDAGVPKYPSC
jgi:guanine deaminase